MKRRPSPYCPARGDIVFIHFSPQAGHEQAYNRPALVLTDEAYNRAVGLCIVCPVTSKVKGYSFEVPLPSNLNTVGVVLADQVKSHDWNARNAQFVESGGPELVEAVLDVLADLLQM